MLGTHLSLASLLSEVLTGTITQSFIFIFLLSVLFPSPPPTSLPSSHPIPNSSTFPPHLTIQSTEYPTSERPSTHYIAAKWYPGTQGRDKGWAEGTAALGAACIAGMGVPHVPSTIRLKGVLTATSLLLSTQRWKWKGEEVRAGKRCRLCSPAPFSS